MGEVILENGKTENGKVMGDTCTQMVATMKGNGKMIEETDLELIFGKTAVNTQVQTAIITITGTWKDHRKNGYGIHTWNDGSCYRGFWKDGSRHEKGTFTWKTGGCYEGEWEQGQINGSGTYYFADGGHYIGYWVNGKRFGSGMMHWSDGVCAEQEWHESRFDKQNKGPRPSLKRTDLHPSSSSSSSSSQDPEPSNNNTSSKRPKPNQ